MSRVALTAICATCVVIVTIAFCAFIQHLLHHQIHRWQIEAGVSIQEIDVLANQDHKIRSARRVPQAVR